MLQSFKRSWLALVMLVACAQSSLGFSLLGPFNEAYQVPAIGYNLIPSDEGWTDIGAPKNIGQGFRWNTRNLYYAFDAGFFTYFGSEGGADAAVDQAFAVLNSLTNLSAYPADLGGLPLDTRRFNYSAEAMELYDVKSLALGILVEQLGLTQPERYVWTLHDAFLPGGATCPNYEYIVIQRNFDPVTDIYSSYVNGVLYTFDVREFCGLTPDPFGRVVHQAVPVVVDPNQNASAFNSVASLDFEPGMFYTGLTKDDIGGLRYLMATNRIQWEDVSSDSFLIVTNNSLQVLVTSNLANLSAAALTNPPAALQALFPGVTINTFNQGISNIITTNVTAFFTNYPFSPPGTAASLVLVTNFTTNVTQVFFYEFGNLVTNQFFTKEYVTTETISFSPPSIGVVGGTGTTNTNFTTTVESVINGSYFLLPSNALCGFSIVSNALSTIVATTNVVTVATNFTATNVQNQVFSQTIITYFTNQFLVVSIPVCVTNGGGAALREGVDKLNFFRHDFDSLLGTFWSPITNTYTLTGVSNNAPFTQQFARVVTEPDFLFTTADLTSGPGAVPTVNLIERSFPSFVNVTPPSPGNPPPPGPGTMQSTPQVVITLNRVGTNILFDGTFFVYAGEGFNPPSSGIFDFMYGSFDGSTNPPVVYPSSVSLSNLESQVFLQILLSGPLPNGQVGTPYSVQLQVSGFQPPFAWSLAPNSPGLPPGLSPPTVTGADTSVAVLAGTPTTAGIYDFNLQVQDSTGRVTQRNFTIEIDP
jgi:hypothetical protein